MAHTRIITTDFKITKRGTDLVTSNVFPPITKDLVYTRQALDIIRIQQTDGLVTIPIANIPDIKLIHMEAKYTQDDPTALPTPIVHGDFAPFKMRIDGIVYDFNITRGLFHLEGSCNQLQVSTDYSYAPIEIAYIIVS